MNLGEKLRALGSNVVHLRFTHAQIVEAALVTIQGVRARLTTLELAQSAETEKIAYLAGRLRELRRLIRQLDHDDEKDRVRQLVHMRHMLHVRIRKLAEANSNAAGILLPADEEPEESAGMPKEPQPPLRPPTQVD